MIIKIKAFNAKTGTYHEIRRELESLVELSEGLIVESIKQVKDSVIANQQWELADGKITSIMNNNDGHRVYLMLTNRYGEQPDTIDLTEDTFDLSADNYGNLKLHWSNIPVDKLLKKETFGVRCVTDIVNVNDLEKVLDMIRNFSIITDVES